MITNWIRDLIAWIRYERYFAQAYNKGQKGLTLPEIFREASGLALKFGKIKEIRELPQEGYAALEKEYMNLPRMTEDSEYRCYFELTHPSYIYVDERGNELDIRDVMKMDVGRVFIAPRTEEIRQMWNEYSDAYLEMEKRMEHAIKTAEAGEDISINERKELENAIDRYNDVYTRIRNKEQDDHLYIIRDRREFVVMMFSANYLGAVLKKTVYEKGAGINISHIGDKSASDIIDVMIKFDCTMLHIFPRIFDEKEINYVYDQVNWIIRGEYYRKFKDPRVVLEKYRDKRIKEHLNDFENNRYFFLDEDRMGVYRMSLETGLSKEEIWESLGFEKHGGKLGTEKEYVYHSWDPDFRVDDDI